MVDSSSAHALGSPETATKPTDQNRAHSHAPKGSLAKLMVGAIGVVYGDIGTSPLYALRETFTSHRNIQLNHENLLGVLSLMFWSLMLIVTIKYVIFLMRADNRGEGGSLALLALISRKIEGGSWTTWIVLLGVFATALFVGDSMITPAISVLSAVGGLKIINPAFEQAVVPLTLIILVGLFILQRSGTTKVGALFGPIMVLFFLVIGSLGVINIMRAPQILAALSPHHAILFFVRNGFDAFLSLGSAVLAVTGAEALYADMGHFGARPIKFAWIGFCFPALILNYLGQGALLLTQPSAITNPFFLLAPAWALVPMVILATAATIIASQAVISGAFSVTQASVQLGFLPRLSIKHTSADAHGQIYVGFVNWGLMICVAALVITFKNDSNLAAAYGIAVTGTMTISTILFGVVMFRLWNWNVYLAGALLALLLVVDLSYLTANLLRIPEGGWVPLLIGVIIFTLLTTWSRGRELLMAKMRESALPLDLFIKSAKASATRVPGTAVFLTSTTEGVPPGLLHNMKHNKVLHERVVFLTVKIEEVPFVPEAQRLDYTDLGNGFFRLVVTYGFMQEPDIPMALVGCNRYGPMFKMMETSFFLNRQTLIASDQPGMSIWREVIFSWMLRNATSAMEFFRLPTNRVVELGSQVEI